jgi:flagellar biosynthesis/type III secretory pathway protein FliH
MRPLVRALENFGDPGRHRESDADRALKAAVAAARGEGHAAGYADGFAAALAQCETEDRAILSAVREAVRDLELRQTGARVEAIAALRPVVEALARIAAPAAAAAGLADSVTEAVAARLDRGRRERLVVHVAPERVAMLRDHLDDASLTVAPDPALGRVAARLEWEGGGALFDPQACLDAALEAIDAHFTEIASREMKHAG